MLVLIIDCFYPRGTDDDNIVRREFCVVSFWQDSDARINGSRNSGKNDIRSEKSIPEFYPWKKFNFVYVVFRHEPIKFNKVDIRSDKTRNFILEHRETIIPSTLVNVISLWRNATWSLIEFFVKYVVFHFRFISPLHFIGDLIYIEDSWILIRYYFCHKKENRNRKIYK